MTEPNSLSRYGPLLLLFVLSVLQGLGRALAVCVTRKLAVWTNVQLKVGWMSIAAVHFPESD